MGAYPLFAGRRAIAGLVGCVTLHGGGWVAKKTAQRFMGAEAGQLQRMKITICFGNRLSGVSPLDKRK
jgi:hypothetical protein